MGVNLLPQSVDPLVQLLQLAVGFLVLAGQGFQLLNLLLDALQLVLCLDRRFHLGLMAVSRSFPQRLHHGKQEFRNGKYAVAVLPRPGRARAGSAGAVFRRDCHSLQSIIRTLPRPQSSSTRSMKLRSGWTL